MKQRIGDKIFRNFPKCSKMTSAINQNGGLASRRTPLGRREWGMTMDASASRDVSVFEDFRLDRCGGGLFRRDDDGAFTRVEIGSRALDILGGARRAGG